MASVQRTFYVENSDTTATLPTGYDEMYVTIPEHRRGPGYLHSITVYGTNISATGLTLTLSAWVGPLGDVCLVPETTAIPIYAGQSTAGAWSAILQVNAAIPSTTQWDGQIGFKMALSSGTGDVSGVRLVWES